ncbi:MAG: hypothetical protein E6K84_06455 [Thaumarchaeota archaeon]|nr:MAG: hypothetical protein E6K84_06455 [Nitrososphaerota archaeon]
MAQDSSSRKSPYETNRSQQTLDDIDLLEVLNSDGDVMYPASCNDIMTACSGMSEFSKAEKDWFGKALPHGTFSTAADVKKAVGV